ncbi:hypothetical protein [Longispora urticae]
MKKSALIGALIATLALILAAMLGNASGASAGNPTLDQTDGTCSGCSAQG